MLTGPILEQFNIASIIVLDITDSQRKLLDVILTIIPDDSVNRLWVLAKTEAPA
jgi:hypothetical protein